MLIIRDVLRTMKIYSAIALPSYLLIKALYWIASENSAIVSRWKVDCVINEHLRDDVEKNHDRRRTRMRPLAIQSDFATSRIYVTTGTTRGEEANFKGLFYGWLPRRSGFLGYLRPRSRLYWPPYLQRFAASSVISGIQLANTAYTPTIIRCRQNRPLIWISFIFVSFSFFLFVLSLAFWFCYVLIARYER